MRERLKRMLVGVVAVLGMMVPAAVASGPVMAGSLTTFGDTIDTNLFGPVDTDKDMDDPENGIMKILSLIVTVLLYGIGAAAVVGVVIAGILYLTARDNEAQVQRSKKLLFEIVLGLIAWAMLWTVLRWLIPSFTGFGD